MKSALTPHEYSRLNFDQKPRRVGFELEFTGISMQSAAKLVQKLYGGTVEKKHKNLFLVDKTELGVFKVELDARPLKHLAQKSEKKKEQNELDWPGQLESIVSSALSGIIPIEIVSPPIQFHQLARLDEMVGLLRTEEAYDTKKSMLSAFGLHINPEVPSFDPKIILAFLQSYILLSDWFKLTMPLDFSRKCSGFIKEYPREYCEKVLCEQYHPNLDHLIMDYLDYNASRNRAMDLLPLFAYLREDQVLACCSDGGINTRPTFHYRLANSQFSNPDWSISTEWRRWLYVEALAQEESLRGEMAEEYPLYKNSMWAHRVEEYIL